MSSQITDRAHFMSFGTWRRIGPARAFSAHAPPSLATLLACCALACGALACGDSGTSSGGSGTGAAGTGTGAAGSGAGEPTSTGAGGSGGAAPAEPVFVEARTGIEPSELGVIVNDADPLSVAIAEYYVAARGIPEANVVHLTLPSSTADSIGSADFAPHRDAVLAAFEGTGVQALAITWTKPYRVENMSITSAMSLGWKAIGDTCTDPNANASTPNPYAMAPRSTRPFDDLGFRPSMVIPATTIEEATALIDRGVASDDTWPSGSAHLMVTTDLIRSARCREDPMYGYVNECQILLDQWDTASAADGGSGVAGQIVMANSITGVTDVLFYVQGLASVPDLETNTYLPGAVADHLTSYGGQIPNSGQMSAIEFLRAGATGSFGTVVEPCAYQQKFPDPAVLVPRYFIGGTLIEAYWGSVDWPAEGIFIGEPLARPWGSGSRSTFADGTLTIETTTLEPGRTYVLEAADAETGPWTDTGVVVPVVDKYRRVTLSVPNAERAFYRLTETSP